MPGSIAAWGSAVLLGLFGTLTATATNLNIDFAGNTLPAGWTLDSVNGGGINNERLESQATDQSATISYSLSQPVASITISYHGSIQDSYWGSFNLLMLNADSSTLRARHNNEGFNFGNDNIASLTFSGESEASGPGVADYPEVFSDFLYEFTFSGNTATYQITDTATSTVLASLTRTATPFSVSDVETISFQSFHTTGSGITWIDDIEIAMVAVPIPASVWLFGSALGLLRLCRNSIS